MFHFCSTGNVYSGHGHWGMCRAASPRCSVSRRGWRLFPWTSGADVGKMAGERRPCLFLFLKLFLLHFLIEWFFERGEKDGKTQDNVCDLRTSTCGWNNATGFLWVCEVKTWQNHTKSYAEEVWLPALEKQCLPPSRTLEFLPAEHPPISTGKGFSRCLGPNNCFAVDFKWILISLLAFHALLHHVFMKFVRFSVMIFVCKLSTEAYWHSGMFFLHFPMRVCQPTRWFRWGFTGPCCTVHSTMVEQGCHTRRCHSQNVKTLASNIGLYTIDILNARKASNGLVNRFGWNLQLWYRQGFQEWKSLQYRHPKCNISKHHPTCRSSLEPIIPQRSKRFLSPKFSSRFL